MKFGVPWSVKGIRPEARETAKEAARRSGMPLGDWLNAVILNSAAEVGVTPEPEDEYSDDQEGLAAVHQRLDDLARKIERLGASGPAAYAPPRARSHPDQFAPAPYAPPGRGGIDRAVAEISARQRMLNSEPPPPAMRTPEAAAPMPAAVQPAPRAPTQDLSGLEEQLRNITAQIETLRRPGVEDAINALRGELSEIGRSLSDAMPRQSIETIEQQIQGLSRRISEGRQAGIDGAALSGIEQGLAEVRDTLRHLTPAEGLTGFIDAVSGLTHKIDLIVAKNDPATLQQLDAAIVTLREMAAHVASNETVSKLAGYVQTLAQRVEQMAHAGAATDAIGNLEQRVAALSDALNERAQHGGTVPPRLEALVTSLSDKIEQIQQSRSDNLAVGHLEDRIVKLVERLDASDSRLVHLEAIERGLADLLVHLDKGSGLRADHPLSGPIDAVDRLAAVAQDIRGDAPITQPVGKVAVRAVVDAPPVAPPVQAPQPAPQAAAPAKRPPMMPGVKRPAIDPTLPPDQPIEPGSMPPRATADLAARIAASEAALGPANPAAGNQPGEKLSFIAAARRAAQAAALETPAREEPANPGEEKAPSFGAKLARRVKKLFVAASVIAITVGAVEIASNYYDFGLSRDGGTKSAHLSNTGNAKIDDLATGTIGAEKKSADTPMTVFPASDSSAVNVITMPSFTNPPPATVTPPAAKDADVTNSIPHVMLSGKPIVPAIPMPPAVSNLSAPGNKLPAALGGSTLRTAAMNGNPAAAYEIGVRYAEGRGVAANLEEAARWFERAAGKGLAPAQFRLASLLEKGQGVKKDLSRARKLYLAAATKGNAKAMHNLAVLYAEGVDGKPDYAVAAQWFQKAANRGVADSQYNLAILYARGLGVEKSFADSYKWFALAAIQGDRESGKKRDDIASRLDAKTLAAAQHAVKSWKAEPQPEEAIAVPHPPGGWDHADPASPPAKPRPRAPGAYEIGKR